jgi:hypothetical protein
MNSRFLFASASARVFLNFSARPDSETPYFDSPNASGGRNFGHGTAFLLERVLKI